MYLTAAESRVLARIFGLLSEDMAERAVREAVGHDLLELLQADHYASFVWDEASRTFGKAVFLNMDPQNLASYDAYYQYHDPITFKLQARREPTLVTQVMPQRELMRTEFFNDFLARDGLHWGVNAYSFVGDRNIGVKAQEAHQVLARLLIDFFVAAAIGANVLINVEDVDSREALPQIVGGMQSGRAAHA